MDRKEGFGVLCPFCSKEMEEGTLRSRGGNYFLPDGQKEPWLYREKSFDRVNAVALPPSPYTMSFQPEWPKAYCCRECHKIIIDY
jgi:hypothetical protein